MLSTTYTVKGMRIATSGVALLAMTGWTRLGAMIVAVLFQKTAGGSMTLPYRIAGFVTAQMSQLPGGNIFPPYMDFAAGG